MRKISNAEREKEKEKDKKLTDQNENEIKTLEQSLKSLISQKDQVISYQEKTVGELRTKLEVILTYLFIINFIFFYIKINRIKNVILY